jgi:hypothetical protein
MKLKSVNKHFTLIIHYKFRRVHSYETMCYYNTSFCKRKYLHRAVFLKLCSAAVSEEKILQKLYQTLNE